MNPSAQQIHAENAERIKRERASMLLRYPPAPVKPSPRHKIKASVGEASAAEAEGRERNCLRCHAAFMSTGPGNRLCVDCRRLTESFLGAN